MATIDEIRAEPVAVRTASVRGYGIILTATLIWASSAVILDYLLSGFSLTPLTLAFWRDFLAGGAILLFLLLFRPDLLRVGWRRVPFLVAYAVVGVAWVEAAWIYSIRLNGAGVATALIYTAPAFVAVMSWRLFGESIGWAKVGAVFLTLLGSALVAGIERPAALLAEPLGAAVGLASGFGFALFTMFGKSASNRMNPWTGMGFSFTIGSLAILLTRSWADVWSLGRSTDGWLILVILALGPTVFGDGLYLYSMSFLPASVASIFVSLEPAMTAGMAYVVLGERMSAMQLLGGALIIGAVVLLHANGEALKT